MIHILCKCSSGQSTVISIMSFSKYSVLNAIFTLPTFMSTARGIGAKAGYIYTLAVKKKYWGTGIGWELLAEALKRHREMGFKIVRGYINDRI